jgi:2-polyprenyl-3-methyl-5-hydroxy-6-metoxy-1,4-benzoquinol methylase
MHNKIIKDKNHMGFYEEISRYYDNIFPAGEEQIKFLEEVLGRPPKTVLDIACGTGGYSIALAKHDYNVTASDLDAEMIRQLEFKARNEGLSIKSLEANMLDLDNKIFDKFNLAFCIGNSIVHLDNLNQIKEFLFRTKKLLENEGGLVLQIINFDRIILKNIKSLPAIEDKKIGLSFERDYKYDSQNNTIYFKTKLSVDGKLFENEIPLYPLLQDELVKAVSEAGYKKIKLFGDFCGNEFDKYNSFMLVLWAR